MKYLVLLFISFLHAPALFSQSSLKPSLLPPGAHNTYALVIGISDYENKGIPALKFAHRDAIEFAKYLQSKAGGSVAPENIKLLTNEQATLAAIDMAMNWLEDNAEKNDLVYFYFAGHGDKETDKIVNRGYLLSYNSPPNNYRDNALEIDALNEMANTLSVKSGAKVILITDACHSGDLAGKSIRGSYLVAEQLRIARASETRITSCAADQLSFEDERWGGGRGVFSYYLVNGLKGMAVSDNTSVITLKDIRQYMDSSFASDPILAGFRPKQDQRPFIAGDSNFTLAVVDRQVQMALKKQASPQLLVGSSLMKPLGIQPQQYLFNFLQQNNPEEVIDFFQLDGLSNKDIPFVLLHNLAARPGTQGYRDTLKRLEEILRGDSARLQDFNNKLVVLIHDRGEKMINLYLAGDEAEMERRRYYNSSSNGYDVYPKMFSVASKLIPPNYYLYPVLQVDQHYFAGVVARLKAPVVVDPKPWLELAMSEQKKAVALAGDAAYIQNELGILYLLRKEYTTAEKYFIYASQLAPEWVIPPANLIALYGVRQEFQKAIEYAGKANALQKDFQLVSLNSGIVYEQKGDLLQAEELYRKSIRLNSRHYLPFERLGYVYINTTQYQLADSFFYEASLRKKGFHFKKGRIPIEPNAVDQRIMAPYVCRIDTLKIGKKDILGLFDWAYMDYEMGYTELAEKKFKEIIALDKSNPLAFHYLGKLLFGQQRWEEADIIFNLATQYYLEPLALDHYIDSMAQWITDREAKKCIILNFKLKEYPGIEDHYYLARLYDTWNHYTEAEMEYRKIMSMNASSIAGHYELWNMFERTGRYKDAEDVLVSCISRDQIIGQREMIAFYKRMISRFPDAGVWYYKAGVFLYNIAATYPQAFPMDKKTIVPDTYEETFAIRDRSGYMDYLGYQMGPFEYVQIAGPINIPRTEAIGFLLKAGELMQQDEDALADIYNKTGDLYVWQGLAVKASPFYKKAVDLKPQFADTRLKLVDTYNETYMYGEALEQLDSLTARHQINFAKQVIMGRYLIHSGRYSEGVELLKNAQKIHPYKIAEITDLNARAKLLSGQYKEAIPIYKDYLASNPTDNGTMYTLARLYAKDGNAAEAWKWLDMSIAKGFNYSFVLLNDPTWESYYKLPKWKDISARFSSMKSY